MRRAACYRLLAPRGHHVGRRKRPDTPRRRRRSRLSRFLAECCWVTYHLPALGFGERTFKDERQMRRAARRQGVRFLGVWELRHIEDLAYPHPGTGWIYARDLWLQTRFGVVAIGLAFARTV